MNYLTKRNEYLMKKNKSLVALDQRPIRMRAISELEVWHDKIELLEIEIQKFHDTDFKLYNDWLRLTLNDLQEENNSLIDKYKKLVLFHNWVVFTAGEKNISLPHAYFLMSEEDLKFQKGSKEEKEQIEKLRHERTNKINSEMKLNYGDDFSHEDDDENETDSNFNEDDPMDDSFEDDDWAKREELEIRLLREKFQKEIFFFENLTHKKITKKMRQFDEAIDFISDCVYICSQCYRFDIIERIWALAPLKIKTHFNLDFKKQMGVSLDQYLIDVRKDAQRKAGSDEQDEEFNFKAHFENPFSSPKNEVMPENIKFAKVIYRRIMMKIHPDKLSTDFVVLKKNWLDRLWKKIQSAYDKTDVKALQNLHLQVLVALKKYDDLDYSDLKAGVHLLQSELTRLGQSYEDTFEHPAWGFSKLKSYKKLEKVVAEPHLKTAKEIKKDIKRIEGTHAALKNFADSIQASGGFAKSKQRRPTQKRKKKETVDTRQQSLF